MRARTLLSGGAAALTAVTALTVSPASSASAPSFAAIGTYRTGLGGTSAEIVAAEGDRMWVTSASDNAIDIVDIGNPAAPVLVRRLDMAAFGGGVTSVAVHGPLVAAAVAAEPHTEPGTGVFFDRDGHLIASVPLGALPDMVTFTPNGQWALFANEGEPDDTYTVDPEGSVSIVATAGLRAIAGTSVPARAGFIPLPVAGLVRTVSFRDFNAGGPRAGELPPGVRIFGPGATVAQDLEPEYIAPAPDSRTAFVTLQENNAMAVVDIPRARVTRIVDLGLKDHSQEANALDPSDRDGGISIGPWPVKGMFLPDSASAYKVGGATYVVTANEGDARAYEGFDEERRVKDLTLDPSVFPDASTLQRDENIGRLRVTSTSPSGPSGVTELRSFGARSFSIWSASGQLVFDSGDQLERIVAAHLPDRFNATNDANDFDSRSDDKGPEPEGVVVGRVGSRSLAFVGLERVGGVMVFDVTVPSAPQFVQYLVSRDFSVAPHLTDAAPEGLAFLPANASPNGKPLLIVAHEVSGSVRIFTTT